MIINVSQKRYRFLVSETVKCKDFQHVAYLLRNELSNQWNWNSWITACGYMTRGYRCLIISKRYITSKLFFLWNDCFPEQRISQDKIIVNDCYSEPLETALRYISHRWTVHLSINWRTSCPKVIRRRYMTYKGGVFGQNRVLFYDKMQRNSEPRKNRNASMMSRWQTLAKRIFFVGQKKCSADILPASGCISMFFFFFFNGIHMNIF